MMLTLDPLALTATVQTVATKLQADAVSPGSVAYFARGAVTVNAAAGVANTETGAPTQPNQAFEIGSQTKMMTAAVILQLVGESRLDLDAPAAAWLAPETIAGIANAQIATLRQLLNHSSGIVNITSIRGDSGMSVFVEQVYANPDEIFTVDGFLDIGRGLPAEKAPGEAFSYSNTGYLLLQKVIEQVTGQPYAEVMAERVFRPLGMEQARVGDFTPDANRWASYVQLPNGPVIDVTPARVDFGGTGGVVATAADMVRFMQALLPSGGLVPEGLRVQQFSPFNPPGTPADSADYGLGIELGELPGLGQFIGHSGQTLGTLTASWAGLDHGVVYGYALNGILSGNSATEFETISIAAGTLLSTGALPEAALAPVTQLALTSGSAAGVNLTADGAGTHLALAGVTVKLDQSLVGLARNDVNFADGSVLIVGDGTSGTAADGLGVNSDILRDAEAAADRDNQLLGLTGNDTLSGGGGADAVRGGHGDDLLDGRGGADTLDGGDGTSDYVLYVNATGSVTVDLLNRVSFGADGNDRLVGFEAVVGGAFNDSLRGDGGNNTLSGGAGDDTLDGDAGNDVATYSDARTAYRFSLDNGALVVTGPTGTDRLQGIESLRFGSDAPIEVSSLGSMNLIEEMVTIIEDGVTTKVLAERYSGPVSWLQYQVLGIDGGDVMIGTSRNDFFNLLGGDDAANGGAGDDVLDGGSGSNFLTGGAGRDDFFLHGRGGTVTWATITDWQANERLSVWGWRPGVSTAQWVESAGTTGYTGVTMHGDLDGNGVIDTSVTWAGMTAAQLPTPLEFDGLLWFT